ncbi:MAG: type IV pilin protein [Halofilum sp. (in: g-proteobacteria)]
MAQLIDRRDSGGVAHGGAVRPTARPLGFTLIELMIAVTVLGIIAAIAYPSYQDYVFDGRRTDGQAALMDAAQRFERCYSSSMDYDDCDDIDGSDSPEGYYSVSTHNVGATQYTLEAAPQGVQASDSCGTLTLDQTGRRGISGADSGVTADECW